MHDFHIVTVVTESKYYFPYLQESCMRHGKALTVLGFGQEWKGFNWRIKLMVNYLEKINPYDIVCFVDGYDVICLRNFNELQKKFLNIKSKNNFKILTALETHEYYFGRKFLHESYFGKCNNNLQINAGTYMGFAIELLDVLKKILLLNDDDKADDQVLMTQYCNIYDDYYIDIDCEIFATISTFLNDVSKYVDIENGILKYKNKFPFFLHCPGSTYMDGVLLKLNYNLPNQINDELYYNFTNKILLYLNFRSFIILSVFLIPIILILIIFINRNIFYKKL